MHQIIWKTTFKCASLPLLLPLYNHSQLLFFLVFPPRKQQETNFFTFHCFSQPCLLAPTTFPHLLNPPVFVEEILWTQYQAFFSPVVSWLCSLLWFLAKLLSALLWFPSSDNRTCPLLPPTPSVSFPSLNPQTCHAGFYTRLLSAVSLPVSEFAEFATVLEVWGEHWLRVHEPTVQTNREAREQE